MAKKKAVKKTSKTKQSKGGDARAASLSKKQRSEIAKRAADKRWAAKKLELPKESHGGPLTIGEITFDCAVVRDGERAIRLVSETNFMAAMGMYRSGALSTRREPNEAGAQVPLFLAHKNLKPFAEKHLGSVHFEPTRYITESGSVAHGISDDVIPKVCEIWIDADRAGVLGVRQKLIAAKADILLRGLAHVGIRALIDEATGFQYERPRRELEEYLEQFIADELRRWVRTFPSDYFKELCRLRGVELRTDMRLPQYFGHLTNNLVYRRMAPGLLTKLKEIRDEKGQSSSKLTQWLSEDVGQRALLIHLGLVIGVMKSHDTYEGVQEQMDIIAPVYPDEPGLFHDPADWEEPV